MHSLRQFALAGTVSLAFVAFAEPGAAFEKTNNAIADALFASMEAGPGRITSVGSVTGSGESATISDLIVEADVEGVKTVFRFGSIDLTGASAMDSGRLKIGQSTVGDVSARIGPVTVDIASIVSSNLVIPSADELTSGKASKTEIFYDRSDISDITVTLPTGGKIAIASATFSYDQFKNDRPTSGVGAISNAVVDPSTLGVPQMKKMFSDLGYGPITVNVTFSSSWDHETGLAEVKSLKIAATDVATIDLGFKFLGLTDEVQNMLTSAGDDQAKAMQALQNIQFSHLSLRLENHSIVDRVLDFVSKRQGTSPDDLRKGATAMLPVVLSSLKNPELQASITTAVTTFLAEPKSLTATARPQAPIPFAQLMGPAMMAPHTLPVILGFSITANQ